MPGRLKRKKKKNTERMNIQRSSPLHKRNYLQLLTSIGRSGKLILSESPVLPPTLQTISINFCNLVLKNLPYNVCMPT